MHNDTLQMYWFVHQFKLVNYIYIFTFVYYINNYFTNNENTNLLLIQIMKILTLLLIVPFKTSLVKFYIYEM